jgi:hypothetical protein
MQKKQLIVNDPLIRQGKDLDKEVKAKTEKLKDIKGELWDKYGEALLDRDTGEIELQSLEGSVKLQATRSCSHIDCPDLQLCMEDASFPVHIATYNIRAKPTAYSAVHKLLKDAGMLSLVNIEPEYEVDKYAELIKYEGAFKDKMEEVVKIAVTKKVTF